MASASEAPLGRAYRALDGLSVGDAFGAGYFAHARDIESLLARRALNPAPWAYTDDTEMALSVVAMLRRHGGIDQDGLAVSFAAHYDLYRGYGPSMHALLAQIRAGKPWRRVAGALFEGRGSYGNGVAMRVAPIGGYFADDHS